MGAYLSAPVTDKFSSDVDNELMNVGSSSMQGWRRSQEDAHNVILNYDDDLKASFFAVYDGHGGAEVAIYCSEKLPTFLKNLDKFKDKNFHEALIEAFIGMDGDILKEETMEVLKKIAGEKNPPILLNPMDEEEDEDEDDEEIGEDENLAELCQESRLPLHEVLLKYGRPKNKIIEKVEDAIEPGTPGGSGLNKKPKPLSPFLRGKRESREISSSEVCSSAAGSSSSATATTSDDSAVSSSSQAPGPSPKKSVENGSAEASPAKSSEKETNEVVSCSPDSSAGKKRNGNTSTEGQSSSADVSSSSSLNKENGEDSVVPTSAAESVENVDSNDHDESSESEDDDFNAAAEMENSDSDGEEVEFEEEEDDDDDDDDDEDDEEEGFDCCADDPESMIDVPGKDSGCTAVVALIVGKDLYVANAGDSRCVVCRNGKAIEMSLDHKPEDEEETQRIEKAGGKITLDGRVNGGLNLSRAIGDHTYKKNKSLPLEEQMISAKPDIRKIVITDEDEFMILACDGIWNFMSSEKVIQFVKERIDKGNLKMSQICEELFDVCLAADSKGDGTGCDNMTAVVVNFKDKILQQPTNLKPEEIETVFVVNKIENDEEEEDEDEEMDSTADQQSGSAAPTVAASAQQALKRSASPPAADENGDVDNSHNHKRLKTEENGSSSSTTDPDQSSINSTTTEGASSGSSGSASSKGGVSLEGPQPSVTTTTNESDSST